MPERGTGRGRGAWRLLAAALALAGGAAPAAGQRSARAVETGFVRLRLQPHVLDTLRLRFDQAVEMRRAGVSSAPVMTSMTVLSRSIIERVEPEGAVVLAITDSVALTSSTIEPRALERARRAMQGRRSRMRVRPDGGMAMLDAPESAAARVLGKLPGTLPDEPVAVGTTWTRTMPLPWGDGALAATPGGRLDVVFRLDSLSRDGALAWVSMRGALSRPSVAPPVGGTYATSGVMTGSLLVDLRRGWMTDSRATFTLTALVAATAGAPAQPMTLTVVQRLRAN